MAAVTTGEPHKIGSVTVTLWPVTLQRLRIAEVLLGESAYEHTMMQVKRLREEVEAGTRPKEDAASIVEMQREAEDRYVLHRPSLLNPETQYDLDSPTGWSAVVAACGVMAPSDVVEREHAMLHQARLLRRAIESQGADCIVQLGQAYRACMETVGPKALAVRGPSAVGRRKWMMAGIIALAVGLHVSTGAGVGLAMWWMLSR